MKFSERQLHDHLHKKLLFGTPDEIKNIGLEKLTGFLWDSEVRLAKHGIADLIGYRITNEINPFDEKVGLESVLKIHVLELKVDPINAKHTDQILRYISGLHSVFEYLYAHKKLPTQNYSIIGSLIGPSFCSGLYHLENRLIDMYTYNLSLTGIHFSKVCLVEEIPSFDESQLDFTKRWFSDLKQKV